MLAIHGRHFKRNHFGDPVERSCADRYLAFTRDVVQHDWKRLLKRHSTKNRDERYQTSKDLLIDLKRLSNTTTLEEWAAIDRSASLELPLRTHDLAQTFRQRCRELCLTSASACVATSLAQELHTAAILILALASVVIVAVAAANVFRRPEERRAAGVAAGEIRTIAVFPLANLSGDPAQEYFADGMTDELITEIARLGDVQVISRGSVMRFKNTTTPIPEIARQLGADARAYGIGSACRRPRTHHSATDSGNHRPAPMGREL